jgi:hypothetical protein
MCVVVNTYKKLNVHPMSHILFVILLFNEVVQSKKKMPLGRRRRRSGERDSLRSKRPRVELPAAAPVLQKRTRNQGQWTVVACARRPVPVPKKEEEECKLKENLKECMVLH